MSEGIIFDIKEFALHDGAGIRTTVFLKGCPLRCVWCHNPEGQKPEPELFLKKGCTGCGLCRRGCSHSDCAPFGRCLHICPKNLIGICGRKVSAEELAEELKKRSEGRFGITLSGGEPLMQPEFTLEMLRLLEGRDTCMETCGYAEESIFREAVSRTSFVYMDVKLADSALHKKYTGRDNDIILSNLEYLKACGTPFVLRVPLIPGITDTEDNLRSISVLAGSSPVELLPYNTLAGAKYSGVGREYRLTPESGMSIEKARSFFENPTVR